MSQTLTETQTQAAETATVEHWIDGASVAGSSDRTGPVYNPALGVEQKRVRFASTDDVDPAVQAAARAFPAWRDTSIAKRQQVMFAFRELLNARNGELAAILTERARQGDLGCRGRDRARTRGRRARLRHAGLHEGRVLRERLDGHRRLHAAPARGRRGHHQPVQLPGHGAAVVLPARDRDGQHRGAEALREGPERRRVAREAHAGGRPARRRAQRRARRQGRRRRAAAPPHRPVDLVRRLDADRAVHLLDGHGQRQAGAGARRREEPHARAARRRPRPRRRRRRERGLRLGRRAMHGDLGRARGRLHRRRARREDRRADVAAHDRRRHARLRHGPAHHARAPRQGRGLPRRRGIRRRRRRGRRTRPRGRRRARRVLARPDPRRQGADLVGRVPRRDLRPGALGRAGRRLRGRPRAHQLEPRTATARPSSRTTAAPRGASSAR